jgi:hypothetical protein
MSPHESNTRTDEDTSPFDGRSAALRDASDSGPLFADRYRLGESGLDAGLIAGTPEDPVLVAGVGYPLLGDLALGTVVAYRVAKWNLPGVAVADCSHTPVAAYQTISVGEHEVVLVVGSEKRGGELNDGTPSETPGEIHERDSTDYEVSDEEVTARIGESAIGFEHRRERTGRHQGTRRPPRGYPGSHGRTRLRFLGADRQGVHRSRREGARSGARLGARRYRG